MNLWMSGWHPRVRPTLGPVTGGVSKPSDQPALMDLLQVSWYLNTHSMNNRDVSWGSGDRPQSVESRIKNRIRNRIRGFFFLFRCRAELRGGGWWNTCSHLRAHLYLPCNVHWALTLGQVPLWVLTQVVLMECTSSLCLWMSVCVHVRCTESK